MRMTMMKTKTSWTMSLHVAWNGWNPKLPVRPSPCSHLANLLGIRSPARRAILPKCIEKSENKDEMMNKVKKWQEMLRKFKKSTLLCDLVLHRFALQQARKCTNTVSFIHICICEYFLRSSRVDFEVNCKFLHGYIHGVIVIDISCRVNSMKLAG